ncbi:MAG: hypothetical protein EBX41_02625 [Chitinophagia bacterium]|nr:hypothetical protein [Chitinophagia bacterium]
MKKTNLIAVFSIAALALGTVVYTTACKKTKTEDKEETGYTTEQSIAEKSFTDVQNIADLASNVTSGGSLGYKTTELTAGGCATVTRAGDSIVVDFGATNCLCHDGRYRRGVIVVHYTGRYADSGSTHTVTFRNYYQNDNQVTGTKTVTNLGNNSLGQPTFSVSVNGAVILASGAGTLTSVWTRTRTWTAGYTTPTDWTDDVYSITGSGSITRPSGAVVNVNITTPLIVAASCRWIEAGTIAYTLSSGATRTINYGTTPACDNTAILTLPSGTTYTITMP